jgi:hypothetical protein
MTSYRLYCLDRAGNISLADLQEAETDKDAIAQADQMKGDARICEVWEGKRLVARFGAIDAAVGNSAFSFER